jgi:hypothetical protein
VPTGQNVRVKVEKVSGTGKYNISVSSNEITPSERTMSIGVVEITPTTTLPTTTTPVTTTTTPSWRYVQLGIFRFFSQLMNIFRMNR